ncbi:MAG: DUF2946 family protein [Hylemonella sp.]
MQLLRHARAMARFALVWFVLSLGLALASPWVHPQSMDLVCSAGGAMKLIVQGDDDAKKVSGATLDCPLCVTQSAPASPARNQTQAPSTLVQVLWPIASVHRAGLTALPPPSRGPPELA